MLYICIYIFFFPLFNKHVNIYIIKKNCKNKKVFFYTSKVRKTIFTILFGTYKVKGKNEKNY